MKALFIIDVQNDFITGSLAVREAEKVIPVINQLMNQFDWVFASQDCHPEQTSHFDKWPAHCVSGKQGADFPPKLLVEKIDHVFLKGTSQEDDGYSVFESSNIEPVSFLRDKKVTSLYLCGIALEFCVKSTALDALKNDFEVCLIKDAIATFSRDKETIDKEYEELEEAGAKIVLTKDIK